MRPRSMRCAAGLPADRDLMEGDDDGHATRGEAWPRLRCRDVMLLARGSPCLMEWLMSDKSRRLVNRWRTARQGKPRARAHSVAVARTAGWQRRMDLRSRYEHEWECEWE